MFGIHGIAVRLRAAAPIIRDAFQLHCDEIGLLPEVAAARRRLTKHEFTVDAWTYETVVTADQFRRLMDDLACSLAKQVEAMIMNGHGITERKR